MKIVETISGLRHELASAERPIALVPTMGFFHAGHLELMRAARHANATLVVSLFVNPAQFGPGEDLGSYPRDVERDRALAAVEGVDLLFAPEVEEIYPSGFGTTVSVAGITETLEGAARGRSHFDGVATVVTKLFNIVAPDVAYFGQKDAQQVAVIRKLVRDLNLPVEIAEVATVRDPDGLALSSRNVYLTEAEREGALALSRALGAAEAVVRSGEREAPAVLAAARDELRAHGVEPEYVELRSSDDLAPATRVNGRTLLALAARVGRARLIDNTILGGDQG